MIVINKITDVTRHIDGLKAVIFDLDDTLYGEKEYVRSGYSAVGRILPQIDDVEGKLLRAFEAKKSAIDEVLNAEGIYSEEIKQKCLDAYRNHEPSVHFYEGVKQMLIDLRKKGYLLGVITDGRPEGQRAKIRALSLENYVDHVIVTDELGGVEFRKPNEKPFLLMLEKLGVERAGACYVGDNVKKDFIAPEKLGMTAILFKNEDGLY